MFVMNLQHTLLQVVDDLLTLRHCILHRHSDMGHGSSQLLSIFDRFELGGFLVKKGRRHTIVGSILRWPARIPVAALAISPVIGLDNDRAFFPSRRDGGSQLIVVVVIVRFLLGRFFSG